MGVSDEGKSSKLKSQRLLPLFERAEESKGTRVGIVGCTHQSRPFCHKCQNPNSSAQVATEEQRRFVGSWK